MQPIEAKIRTMYGGQNPPRVIRIMRTAREQRKVAFSTSEGLLIIRCDDISHCEASGNYCKIFKSNGQKLMLSKPLKTVQKMLPGHTFIRVHQSYLVNMEGIQQLCHEGITLDTGIQIPVSRRCRSEVTERIKAYIESVTSLLLD